MRRRFAAILLLFLTMCASQKQLSLNEKIGQMFAVRANGVFMDGHAKWYPYDTYIWQRSPDKEIWGHFSSPEPE